MDIFSGSGIKVHVLALQPGEYVMETVKALIEEKGIRNGAVISGIGTLDYCKMHMGGRNGIVMQTWEDTPLEFAGMQGVIADGQTHIHWTVSDKQSAVAGHPHDGCRIFRVGEIVVVEFNDISLMRAPGPKGPDILMAKD
jgi:predicted DNA-binding protein with PD1-like motif